MSRNDFEYGLRHRFKHYALRVLFSLIVLFVSLEIGLQIAAVVLPKFLVRSGDEVSAADDRVILCVGDSHTFGAPLPPEDAYPAQLNEKLNRVLGGQGTRVVNLGIPGQNSAMVANRLEKQIQYYRPDLVVVWVGLNNSWNFNEFDLDSSNDSFIRWRQWLLRSKVLRLIVVSGFRETGSRPSHMPREKMAPGTTDVQQWDLGGEIVEIPTLSPETGTPTLDSIQAQRRSDYARMIRMTQAYDIPIVFISYPLEILPNQQETNLAIRSQAERYGVPVVSSFAAYKRAVADGHTGTELIVAAVGPHPTRLLYGYVVDALTPMVRRLLAESSEGD